MLRQIEAIAKSLRNRPFVSYWSQIKNGKRYCHNCWMISAIINIHQMPVIRYLLTAALLATPLLATDLPLMPLPAHVTVQAGTVAIDSQFSVSASGPGATDPRVQFAAAQLSKRVARQTGIPLFPKAVTKPEDATVIIQVNHRAAHEPPQRLGDNESYSVSVADGHIRLTAEEPLGALRGIETILQLVQQNHSPDPAGFSVPAVTIQDSPRFPWRGLSLDVSRHFIPADGIKRTLDGLAAVKLNVFHWHLSDDQGFRIESKKYPRLQELGSDGLFYTQDEVREIVAYATMRGIRVVPEFDMPGHSTSWLPGYPELGSSEGPYEIVRGSGVLPAVMDPTKESTYQFLSNFVGEMVTLFPDEYFHIGGDEVNPKQWNTFPHIQAFMAEHKLANAAALQAYFNQRLLKIVTAHGKRMEGWDEILHPDLPKTIVIQSWRSQMSLWQAAREGYQGVLSAGYYLDLMYPASTHYLVDPMKVPLTFKPKKPGDPAPGSPADLTPDQAKLILGGEAAMWEELATAEDIDAKLWPRLAAIAERFWSPESVTDIPSMYQRLDVVNRWLEWLGLQQRSNLELMRQRLAGDAAVGSLDTFSTVLEPVKGYVRHRHKYTSFSPFNHLVDSIPPESEQARRFRVAVDQYLAMDKSTRSSANLRATLSDWANAAQRIRPLLQSNSLLTEDLPVDDAVTTLCAAALDALKYLDSATPPPANWKQSQASNVAQYDNKPVGDFVIPIASAVHSLVNAVQ
jgi:hexosaminidase